MKRRRHISYIVLTFLLGACSLSNKLPVGKSLYAGADVRIMHSENLNKQEISSIKTKIEERLAPNTNSTILGFPYKVWLGYNIGEPRKKRGIRRFLQDKLGQKPVFYDPHFAKLNQSLIQNLTGNEGYFGSKIDAKPVEKKYKTFINYEVELAPRYLVKNIAYSTADFSIFGTDTTGMLNNSILKPEQAFSLDAIIAERDRVATYFQERGYIYLGASQMVMEVDTNLANFHLNLKLKLAPNLANITTSKFYIHDINVITTTKNEEQRLDTTKNSFDQLASEGLFIAGNNRSYKPKIFTESIVFRPGDVYSKTMQDVSLNRLSNLKNFQFIRNRFEQIISGDSTLLDVNYFLTPIKRKTIKAQVNGLTKSNGLYGSEANLSWSNRNLFHGAEILKFELNGGIDLQFGQIKYGNNYRRISLASDITFPRFILPFHLNFKNINSVPKTNVNVSYEILRRKDFYTLTSSNAGLSYSWRKNAASEINFSPVYFNLIKSSNFSENFVNQILISDNLSDLERYFQILESKLILGMQYKINYTPLGLQTGPNRASFSFGFDIAGNFASLISPKSTDGSGFKKLAGVPFEQFVKADAEGKYFRKMGDFTWANRLFTGFGVPYKNSLILPQTKQYFSGGNNGLRGFRGRSLGPGRVSPEDINLDLFGFNSQGDIKLELNTEIRYKPGTYVEIAGFFDTGNIWTYRDDTFYGQKAKFTKNFINELAADVGVGLRLDFTYLIIRGDLATPIRKPWLDNAWVLKDIQLGNKDWRKQNLIFNLAIAYPF